jgi:GT2 family glycosyltransferase
LTPSPLVLIAIPTLDAGAPLMACLLSLSSQVFRDFEVIVINNGKNPFVPPVGLPFACRTLCPGTNIGFGAAINLAARATQTPFVATLNDDTEPDPSWLDALIREISAEPGSGMCASRIRFFESGRLDSAGMLICLDGSSKQRGHGQPASAFDSPQDVLFPSACAAVYRRKMLEEVGFFDEDYFLYCEDTDLGLRSRWAGWVCRYAPAATVRHHYSGTAGPFSPLKARYVERNRLWVAVKTFPLALLPLVPAVSVLRYFWQFISIRSRRGAAAEFIQSGNSLASAAGIVLGAYAETLISLPQLLRKRAALRRTRKMSSFALLKLLLRYRITARELARS